jgi:tetratricopeptide (TPR) repeat protein
MLTVSPAGLADSIRYGTRSFDNVRILDLRDGNLLFETSEGIEQSVPADLIDRIELSDHPELAEAQAALSEERYDRAIRLFHQLYEEVEAEHLRTFMLGKLVTALDAAGKAEQAVQRYLELIERDRSPFAEAVLPESRPEAEDQRKALAKTVESRAEEASNRVARSLLERLAQHLRSENGVPSTTDPAESEDPVAALLKQDKPKEALKEIEQWLQEAGAPVSRLLHQQGLARAKLGRHKDAALSFMRVIIHFQPSTTNHYVPSLIEAGRAFHAMGEPRKARGLWEEALGLVAEDSDRAERIQELLGSRNSDGNG